MNKPFIVISIKDVRTKSRKIDSLSPLVRKCPHWHNPPTPLSVRTHRKFRKIRYLSHQKVRMSASEETPLSAKCPHWTNLPLDYGRVLWTVPYLSLRHTSKFSIDFDVHSYKLVFTVEISTNK